MSPIYPHFEIEDVASYKIVREDRFPGGTKRRAFRRVIESMPEDEFVYAADYFGYAPYAIGLTALEVGKKLKVFYCCPVTETEVFKKATSLPNVSFEIVSDARTQMEAVGEAVKYAAGNGAKFLPVGLGFSEFLAELQNIVAEAKLKTDQIWCVGGSGTLGRALERAYPKAEVNVVSIGTDDFDGREIDKIWLAPEEWNEPAEHHTPYHSSAFLDEKTWRFVCLHARSGAYVWNIA
jgi:hypothetical protein